MTAPGHQAAEQALARVTRALTSAPADPGLLFDRACLLDRLGRTDAARQAYLDVLAQDFGHAGALANLGTLLLAGGYTSAARTVFAQAVAAHPDDAAARVNLANLLRQSDDHAAAHAEYEAALRLDPGHPEAHQGLSYLLDGIDDARAASHRDRGFTGRALTTARYRGAAEPITVLQLVSARGGNIPTARILDDRIFLTHTLVAEYADPGARLPPHHGVCNAIGDADRCTDALHAAARLLADTATPVLNPPARILPTKRAANARRLAAVPGVVAPRIATVSRASLLAGPPPGFAPPFLVRSPGFHTGQHFRRVERLADLADAVAKLPGETLMVLEYLDAAGPDRCARKYRAMLIGGAILPLHLAISAGWKVHYFTADMATSADHRAEEARFLADMPSVLGPAAMAALAGIAAVLGLDYAGVDFALAPDGRLLLFEANATMTIAPPPPDAMWDYRRPATLQALAAAQGLMRRFSAAPALSGGRGPV